MVPARPVACIRAGISAAGVLILAAAPCFAQATGEVRPANAEAAQLGLVTMAVDVDMRTTGDLLGGYGATLTWDTSALAYVSDTGGGEPTFDNAVVNRTGTATGLLVFGDASAQGLGGRVNIFNVTFQALGSPLSTTALDLEFTSMYAARTFEDLSSSLSAIDGIITVTHFLLNLSPVDLAGTLWEWDPVAGAVRYDLIRGNSGSVSDTGATVDLGSVTCIEDDSADTTTDAGAEAANPDTATPSAGDSFFYLVRLHNGVANQTYGYSHAAANQRLPASGDCP